MPNVRDAGRLHPETVSNYKEHVKRKTRAASRNSKVECVRVDPRVWACAMTLANQDRSRLEVLSETEVIVKNVNCA